MSKRRFLVLLIPYLTATSWYYLFFTQISSGETSSANAYFNISIALSLLANTFLVKKFSKLHLIYAWAITMPILTVLSISVPNLLLSPVLIFLFGFLSGMSLLAYSVYFCNSTATEERGRVGGAIVFISLMINPIVLLLLENFMVGSVFLGAFTFIIHFLKPKKRATVKKISSWRHENRAVLKYLIPWVVFCFVNGAFSRAIAANFTLQFGEFAFSVRIATYLTAAFGALIGGLLADWAGRRIALSVGLISFGVSATISGLINAPVIFILFDSVQGFSWGIFLALYILVVWGDLAHTVNSVPFYAIGLFPLYFFTGLGYLIYPKLMIVPVGTLVLLSCLLIFLSNIFLIFSPELMPKDKREEMILKRYGQRVKEFLKEHR